MDIPLISVVTPVFNDRNYIEKCIQSVLSQDYGNIEHVIVDGGSIDGTLETIKTYADRFPNKIRFVSEPDRGAGDAWNKGCKMTKGHILGLLGADDFYAPGAIKTIVNFFREHPQAYFVYGNCENIDENGKVISVYGKGEFNLREFINTAKYISTPSAFYRKEVMEKIGWCDSSGDDFDVMIRIAKNFRVYHLDKVLSRLTVRQNSVFNKPGSIKQMKEIRRQTFKVSRTYGGSMFSLIAFRYYVTAIIDWLNLGKYFPYLQIILRKLVHFLYHDHAR